MRGSLRPAAGLLGLALLAACAPTPPVAAPLPADSPGSDAARLHAACGARPHAQRMACYDRALLATLHDSGVRAAMQLLDGVGALDEVVRRDGHMLAHSIGLAAYSTPDRVGSTFRECLPTFQSGCYHGVVQAHFAQLGGGAGGPLDAATINAVCADYRGDPEARWLLFQCAHGVGHGLAAYYGHDLPRALAACDEVRSPWEREGCFGGAFMENVQQGTVPHHAIGRPGGPDPAAAGHAGMDHAAMGHGGAGTGEAHHGEARAAFRPLDPADPTYPCSALDARYRRSCWEMQTSAILFFNGQDVPATAAVCRALDAALSSTCFRSLGRDISALTVQDPARAAALCQAAGAAHRADCFTGFVKNVVDVTADAARGLEACRAVGGADEKRACYQAVGEEAWVLTHDPDRRAALCQAAEPEYREACARGADAG